MAEYGTAAPERDADEFYKIMGRFNNKNWFQFARSKDGLGLPEQDIDDIRDDYPHNTKERKYQMLTLWKQKNYRASIDDLNRLVDRFFNVQIDASMEPGVSVTNSSQQSLTQFSNNNNQAASFASNSSPAGQTGSQITGNIEQAAGSVANYEAYGSQPAATSVLAGTPTGFPHQPATVSGGTTSTSFSGPVQENPCMEVHSILVQPCPEPELLSIRQRHGNIYTMKYNKGLVVIINNNFTGRQEQQRDGAKEDVRHLKELWLKLGCEVLIKEDKTCDEIREILQIIAQGQATYNYLAVFIMSHGGTQGDTEVVQGCNDGYVSVNEILLKFTNLESRNWVGIPKLFFFQCCRGGNVDEGIELGNMMSSISNSLVEYEQADYIGLNRVHSAASDMLISYATLPGYAAFRNRKGSWFINAITNIFMKYAWKEHVVELMTRVREAVGERTSKIRAPDGSEITCKEMSESVDRLKYNLYLLLTPAPHS